MDTEYFIKKSKHKSLELFDQQIDKLFIEYLTHVKVMLNSFYLYKMQDLSLDDRIDFGVYDDINEAYDSFSRYDQRVFFMYHLVNMPFNLEDELISGAYDEALRLYKNTCQYQCASDNADFFKHSKKRIVDEYKEKLDEEDFMELYERMANTYYLRDNEKKTMKRELKKKHEDMLVVDPEIAVKKYESEVK